MRLGTWTREAFLPYLLFCMWKTKSFHNLEKVTAVLRKNQKGWISGCDQEGALLYKDLIIRVQVGPKKLVLTGV